MDNYQRLSSQISPHNLFKYSVDWFPALLLQGQVRCWESEEQRRISTLTT